MSTLTPSTGTPVLAKIVPVRPAVAEAELAARPAAAGRLRRTLGRYLPSRRTLGRYIP